MTVSIRDLAKECCKAIIGTADEHDDAETIAIVLAALQAAVDAEREVIQKWLANPNCGACGVSLHFGETFDIGHECAWKDLKAAARKETP